MSLKLLLKLKLPLIIFMVVLIIITVWNDLTFLKLEEVIVFFPLLILYFNKSKYEELSEYGLNISYYIYEMSIFIFSSIITPTQVVT